MYTMVLMMAATSGADTPDFGRRAAGGCTGVVVAAPAGCTGTVMAAPVAPAGCTGTVPAGCHGRHGLLGGHGFLGLRGKLFGGSCHGTPAPSTGCHGSMVLPNTGCHGGMALPTVGGSGCFGTTMPSVGSSVIGCTPTMGTVITGPVAQPPVGMPEVPPKKDDKKEEKKEEKKTGTEL